MQPNYHFRRSFGMVFILGFLFLANTLAFAQASKHINWKRMQLDLDIMEGILNKLLNHSSLELHWGPWSSKARGLYFEGYGVIFQIDYSGYQLFVLNANELSKSIQQSKEEIIELKSRLKNEAPTLLKVKSKPEEEAEIAIAERIETLKEQLTEFLGTYADAIGQLETSDRITVLVNLRNNDSFYRYVGTPLSIEQKQVSMLEATAKKSDILAYRRGSISEKEFRRRVIFNQRSEDDNIRRNVDIMSNIMDTALSKKYHSEFSSEGKTRGIYLEGLGVLFFMKGYLNKESFSPTIREYIEEYIIEQKVNFIQKEKEQESKKKFHELLDEFRNALVEVVGDYGHTLHILKPTEYVVVTLDFNEIWRYSETSPTRFIMKVQKKDLDLYNRGNITLTEFRKRVKFLEF